MGHGDTADSEKYPFGRFLGYEIWKRDPTSPWIKSLWVALTLTGLLYMIFSVNIVSYFSGITDTWDRHHELPANNHPVFSLLALVSATLGLSIFRAHIIVCVSFGVYGLLILTDILSGNAQDSCKKQIKSKTHPWPESWTTENIICYNEMFCEPTRWGRLLRRPGNTLSNVTYLLSSLCIFDSSLRSAYWMSDLIFAVMLLVLAVFSTLWHASNAPWSQYVDIWSMDCCILYLIVRYGCLASQTVLTTLLGTESRISQQLSTSVCVLIYSTIVVGLGKSHSDKYQKRWLHGNCPFSGRARLLGRSNFRGRGQEDVHVVTVCTFAALPVIFTGIPTIIQVLVIGSAGSTVAAMWAFRTLVLGWSYRLFDRWLLDGCVPMNYFTSGRQPSWFCTFCAAIVSPTAVLHFFTGLTLLTGYMHCRSVEEFVSM
ncbi:hypothetical protein IV203_001925 [Nitzschia inconspicua]|uniref:Uncharacterized protein n=1 Tax=Nitzschia inconspicua TaxID=303405 RepID=A0A9K3PRS6_9STRA|nr:hypothetical protein IV203_001925 [Nitzschia inconspicua]